MAYYDSTGKANKALDPNWKQYTTLTDLEWYPKLGILIMIKNSPCRLTTFRRFSPGIYGSYKILMQGRDIFTNELLEE